MARKKFVMILSSKIIWWLICYSCEKSSRGIYHPTIHWYRHVFAFLENITNIQTFNSYFVAYLVVEAISRILEQCTHSIQNIHNFHLNSHWFHIIYKAKYSKCSYKLKIFTNFKRISPFRRFTIIDFPLFEMKRFR